MASAFELDYLRLVIENDRRGSDLIETFARDTVDEASPLARLATDQLERLAVGPVLPPSGQLRWIGGRYLWMRGSDGKGDPGGPVFALAAARQARLSGVESEVLAELCREIARACSLRSPDSALRSRVAAGTSVLVKSDGPNLLAEVTARWSPTGASPTGPVARRVGVGRSRRPELAVAEAAAKANRPRCTVVYAGMAPANGILPADDVPRASDVPRGSGHGGPHAAVVLVRDSSGAFRLGWAYRSTFDLGAVAEAVFVAGLML